MIDNSLTHRVIGCAVEVHRELGPGLLEKAYEEALVWELSKFQFSIERQVPVPINYKNQRLDASFRIDLLINQNLVLELKSVEKVLPIHHAQIITYLRLADKPAGLLLNFNV